jgi:hypothetical protein
MVFELIGDQRELGQTRRLQQQISVEIADADMAHLSRLSDCVKVVDLLGQRYVLVGPVQEEKIDIIGIELSQVTKISERAIPDSAIPSPTSASLR